MVVCGVAQFTAFTTKGGRPQGNALILITESRSRHFNTGKKGHFLLRLSKIMTPSPSRPSTIKDESCVPRELSLHLKTEKDTIPLQTQCPQCVKPDLDLPFTEDGNFHRPLKKITGDKRHSGYTHICWLSVFFH